MDARRHLGWAWLLLCASLALHVADEALNDFLALYNPWVTRIRAETGIPLPGFTFGEWISALLLAIVILSVLTPHAFRNAWGIRCVAYPYAMIMLLNGVGHLAMSFYLGYIAPGTYSSPLLLAASFYLLAALRWTVVGGRD